MTGYPVRDSQLNALNLGLQFYRHQMEAVDDERQRDVLRVPRNSFGEIERKCRRGSRIAARCGNETSGQMEHLHVFICRKTDAYQRRMLAGVAPRLQCCSGPTANDGRDQALDYLENNQCPIYVLLDMRMPQRDGVSTVRRLRNQRVANLRILRHQRKPPPRSRMASVP